MNCVDREQQIALYAGGDLEETSELQQHLAGCAECRLFLNEMTASLVSLRCEAFEATAVDAMRARTMAALRPERSVLWPLMRYAAAVLIVIGGLVAWKMQYPAPLPVIRAAVSDPKLAPVTVMKPSMQQTRRVKKPRPAEPREPVVVKLLTDDPDVVIYWITD
jgi:hypothetical protein